MCLDVPFGSTTNGNPMQIWSCQTNNGNQVFRAPSLGTPWNPAGRLIRSRLADVCIDANAYTTDTNGGPVLIYTCNTRINVANQLQNWTIDAAGALRSVGLTNQGYNFCLFASANDNGASARIWSCTGGDNARWFMDPLGRLRPYSSPSRCLDIPGASTVPWTPLQISDCLNLDQQKWFVWSP